MTDWLFWIGLGVALVGVGTALCCALWGAVDNKEWGPK